MKRVLCVHFICALVSYARADSAVTVAQSADWREASPAQRAQVEKTAQHLALVDCSFFGRGGTATLQKYSISESDTIEAFEMFRRGTIAGVEKHGLSIVSEKRAVDSAIPGRLVLMEGKFGSTRASAVLWTFYSPESAYLLMFISPDRLEVDSPMIRSYLSRLKFADPSRLSSVPPASRLEAAWQAGNRAGEILFGILLVGLPVLAVFVFRMLRTKKEKPNQAPEPTATAVTPPASQEPRQP